MIDLSVHATLKGKKGSFSLDVQDGEGLSHRGLFQCHAAPSFWWYNLCGGTGKKTTDLASVVFSLMPGE